MPNAGAGPFREIANEELGLARAAPYAFRDSKGFTRDAAMLAADGDLGSLGMWAFVARTVFAEDEEPDATALPNEIIRHVAKDGRSFRRQFDVVLTPEADWEMGEVGRPAVVRFGGQVLLFYVGAGGIGVATSQDGCTFTRTADGPALGPTGGWEQMNVPTSPAVIERPDGSLRMYYAVPLAGGSAIGVALSNDGLSWQRIGSGPTLAPREGEIDQLGAGAPYALFGESAEGRRIEYLYYAATGAADKRTIAMAARYGTDGAWQFATAPVFGTTGSLGPTEPVVIPFEGYSLLFATEKAGATDDLDRPAVAIGVAPANAVLPAREPPQTPRPSGLCSDAP